MLTRGPQTVFGGGGITPDIHVDSNIKLNNITRLIATHPDRIIFDYAEQIKNITKNKFNNSYSIYKEKFEITDKQKNENRWKEPQKLVYRKKKK